MLLRHVLALLLILSCTAIVKVSGFVFELEARKYRCFTEELPSNFRTELKYSAKPGYAQFIDVKVTDPQNNVVFADESTDQGSFTLVTQAGGDYAVCFYSRLVPGVKATDGMSRIISFSLTESSEGVHAQLDQKVATAKHMKPIEIKLRLIEDNVRNLISEYQYYKERERALRDTNEAMNTRVLWVTASIFCLLILFGVWQVRYLRNYFRRKRIID